MVLKSPLPSCATVTLGVGFSSDPTKSEGPAQAGTGVAHAGSGPSKGGRTGAARGAEPGARAEPTAATGAEAEAEAEGEVAGVEGEAGAGASPLSISHGR